MTERVDQLIAGTDGWRPSPEDREVAERLVANIPDHPWTGAQLRQAVDNASMFGAVDHELAQERAYAASLQQSGATDRFEPVDPAAYAAAEAEANDIIEQFTALEHWAVLMQIEMSHGESLSDVAEATWQEAKRESGGWVNDSDRASLVEVLAQHWRHGAELQSWHDGQQAELHEGAETVAPVRGKGYSAARASTAEDLPSLALGHRLPMAPVRLAENR